MFIVFFKILLSVIFNTNTSGEKKNFSPALRQAFSLAGNNQHELKRVIEFYGKKVEDSLKLKAATFLIENMPGKGYYKYDYIYKGKEISINLDSLYGISPMLAKSYMIWQNHKNQQVDIRYIGFIEDVKTIKGDDLIENIEYAFKTWTFPWAKEYSFDEFKEYILPYRVANEPLQTWRKTIFNTFISSGIYKLMSNNNITNAGKINSIFRNYKYLHNDLQFHPQALTVQETLLIKGGRCEDLNMLCGYFLRTAGIAVASEYTPSWGNSNFGGHSWLSVLSNKKFTPMNAVFDDPKIGKLPFGKYLLVKAFRRPFRLLKKKSFGIDITKDYIKTKDVLLIESKRKYFGKNIRLGVLNGKKWVEVDQVSVLKNNFFKIQNIARGAIYIVFDLTNDHFNALSDPFFINSGLKYIPIANSPSCEFDLTIPFSTKQFKFYNKDTKLSRWDFKSNSWTIVNYQRMCRSKNFITFSHVSEKGLFRLTSDVLEKGTFPYSRPFIYRNRRISIF